MFTPALQMSSLKSQNEALKRKTRLLEYSVHAVDDTLSTLKSPVLDERLAELIKVGRQVV